MLRIFMSYEQEDAAFATQLTIDLQASGAEIMTDSTGFHDTGFKQFLNEKLPQSQQLIVVQTPEAFQSPRTQAIVDAALKHVQEGRMAGVLCVIARTPNPVGVQALPPVWAATPSFDASQDYQRALARLRWHLGLTDTNKVSLAPPPPSSYKPSVSSPTPTRAGKKFPFIRSSSDQEPRAKDRPLRPLRDVHAPLRARFTFFSLAMALMLVVAGVALFLHQRSTSVKSSSTTHLAPTPIPSPTATPTVDLTQISPTQLYNAVTSRPTVYSSDLSQQDNANWDQGDLCKFTHGAYQASMPAQGSVGFHACFESAFLFSDFAFQAQMTIHSGVDHDGGGLLFRAQNGDDGYRFHVGIDGSYDLTYMANTSLHGIDPALKKTTLLTVIARGPMIFLYVNKQLLTQTSDTSSSQGQLGFMAVSFSQNANVTFTNAQIWRL